MRHLLRLVLCFVYGHERAADCYFTNARTVRWRDACRCCGRVFESHTIEEQALAAGDRG